MNKAAQIKFIYHGEGKDGILHHWFKVRNSINPTKYNYDPATVNGLPYDRNIYEEPPTQDRFHEMKKLLSLPQDHSIAMNPHRKACMDYLQEKADGVSRLVELVEEPAVDPQTPYPIDLST